MLFVRLWDLRRVGWVDHGWWMGRGPKLPLLSVNRGTKSVLNMLLGDLRFLIDIVWYAIETLTCH